MGTPLTDAQWEFSCSQTEAITASSRLRLIHISSCTDYITLPPNSINLNCERMIDVRGAGVKGQPYHLAWQCERIHDYWTQVFEGISCMLDTRIPLPPQIALLGCIQDIATTHKKFLALGLLIAKRRIACKWGRGRAPKFKECVQDLITWQEQSLCYAELLPPTSRPKDIWSPLTTYLLAQKAEVHAEQEGAESPGHS